MNFLSSVPGPNPAQGSGAQVSGLAVFFQVGGAPSLDRLNPGNALSGFPQANPMAMNPAGELLAQQQQTMQLMLMTMLTLLTGLMQGQSGQTSGDSSTAVNSANGAASGGGASSSSGASGAQNSGSHGAPGDKVANAKIVAEVARQKGVDPVTAVACMLVESGGSNAATGDNGTSFGLFQLHRGGELGNMSEAEARDPRRNAEVALSVFAANKGKYSDPGQLAAASQRPADRAGYARKVDAMLPEARRLLGM